MWVLMHGDYPIGVYATEKDAHIAWREYIRRNPQYFNFPDDGPRYCRTYGPFTVNGPAD